MDIYGDIYIYIYSCINFVHVVIVKPSEKCDEAKGGTVD